MYHKSAYTNPSEICIEVEMNHDNQKTISSVRILADAFLIVIAYILAYSLRFGVLQELDFFALGKNEHFYSMGTYAKYLLAVVPGYLYIYTKCGLYELKRRKRIEVWDLVKANILGLLYFAFVLFYVKELDISRHFFSLFFVLNITLGLAFRHLFHYVLQSLRSRGINLKHVVMIGYSGAARGYIDRIKANPQWGYYIHGIIDDEKEKGFVYNGIPILGSIGELEEILRQNRFEEIIISLRINDYYKLRRVVAICEKSGTHTKFIPDYNHIIPTIPVIEDFFGLPMINIRNVPLSTLGNRAVKRLMDLAGGVLALIVFAIPMLAVAVAIKLTTKGRVIYCQERVGLHNKPFKMYKFCSMEEAKAGEDENEWSNQNNQRVTKIGKFIRHTSLDELPQIFNVLKGDMSLIGPRPERPFFVEKFREEIPRYMIKHQVRPGITGWAQVHGLRGDTSVSKRIEYDLYYIENWSVILDIKILWMTIFTGFVNKNAY